MPKVETAGPDAIEGVFVRNGGYVDIESEGVEYATRTRELYHLATDYGLPQHQLIGRKVVFVPSSRRIKRNNMPVATNLYMNLNESLQASRDARNEARRIAYHLVGMSDELPEEREG